MNKNYKNIAELIQYFEQRQDEVIKEAELERLECIERVKVLSNQPKNREEKIIISYIEHKTASATIEHLKLEGIKSDRGTVLNSTDITQLILDKSSQVNETLMGIATELYNLNMAKSKRVGKYASR